MKSRLFLVVGLVAMIAFIACSQLAVAQGKPHYQVKILPKANAEFGPGATTTNPPPAVGLYPTWAAFTGTSNNGGTPLNTDGTWLWPCFGGGATANVDCPTIGDPSIPFPVNGVVVGTPQYTWSLAACDGTTNGSSMGGSPTYIPCGQTASWYEDDANDNTDDLLYSIVITQGTSIIVDSGTVDFGVNTYGGMSPAANIIIYGDQNFGTLGQTGKNNGNCTANYNYPGVGAIPTGLFIVAAGKTCFEPVAGLATVTATTELATPVWTSKTTKGVTTYTVKYTKKYSLTQKWNIWLQ